MNNNENVVNDIKQHDMSKQDTRKTAGSLIDLVIDSKRKQLKEKVNELDKYRDGIVSKYEVFQVIDEVLSSPK